MSLEDQTILVTGSAGFIGSHLVDRLLAQGATVIGVDNFDTFYAETDKRANIASAVRHDGYLPLTLDCTDLTLLERAVPDVPIDAMVHLAAKAGVRPSLLDPLGYVRTNVTGTQAVLEFARRRNVPRFLFASSSSVYGDADRVPFDEGMACSEPISPYAATKRAGELLCATHAHLYGAGTVALRFFTVYGPRQRPDLAIRKFATQMMAHRPIVLHGDGTTARDYTWIDDIIDGMLAALEFTRHAPGRFETINLGGSRMTALQQLVDLLEEALGVEAIIQRAARQPGDVERTCASTMKAMRLLGYAPKVGIQEGIARFAEWMLARERPAARLTEPRILALARAD